MTDLPIARYDSSTTPFKTKVKNQNKSLNAIKTDFKIETENSKM